MTYRISYADGRPDVECETYGDAIATIESEYGLDAEIGHSGGLDEGGDRTLCWADEESSVNDDGARSVAEILRD